MHEADYRSQPETEVFKLDTAEEVFVHLFRRDDAPGIGRLFRAVYGEKYPVKHFYDPALLMEAFEKGESYSIVARTGRGDIIGHMGLFRSSPSPRLYECGAGLVLPEYRKAGINHMMIQHVYEKMAAHIGMVEVWGEAVCNHEYMQKTVLHYKHVETGIEVDLMPAETYTKEKSSSGRVSSVVVFRAYVLKPHTVYIPPVYDSALRFLYSGLDDDRTLENGHLQPPAEIRSHASSRVFGFARVARVGVDSIGAEFDSYWEGIRLFSDRAAEILRILKLDWEDCSQLQGKVH